MGGEVLDVQIADLNDKHFSEIEKALHHHKMIFFREQSLSLADQERFTVVLVNSGPMHTPLGCLTIPISSRSKRSRRSQKWYLWWVHTDSPFLNAHLH